MLIKSFLRRVIVIAILVSVLGAGSAIKTYPAQFILTLNIPNLPDAPTCMALIPGRAWQCFISVNMPPLNFNVRATATKNSEPVNVELKAASLPPNASFPKTTGFGSVKQNFRFAPTLAQVGKIYPVQFTASAGGLEVSLTVQIFVLAPAVPVGPGFGPGTPVGPVGPLPPGGAMLPALPMPPLPAGAGRSSCLDRPPFPPLFFCNRLLLR